MNVHKFERKSVDRGGRTHFSVITVCGLHVDPGTATKIVSNVTCHLCKNREEEA